MAYACIRELLEARERDQLAPWATFSFASKGRREPEPEDPNRTVFQRDRDRILHSKAFRRLKRKTQVFLAPRDDHYRTRLTHTLEVSQIARTVTRALMLNEDLAEAIALGHDLGHTPFGHAGERVLDSLCPGGFRHYEQSLRVVDLLERRENKPGLNLTHEVREGIAHHSAAKGILTGRPMKETLSPEASVLSLSDAIAYINHDVDDAIRAKVITLNDLPKESVRVLGATPSERVDSMVVALIEGSKEGQIGLTGEVRGAMVLLRDYLYREVYPCPVISLEIQKAEEMLRRLFDYLMKHPPVEVQQANPEDSLERRVTDFVAGMTDEFALQLYGDLLLPAPWSRA